MHLGSCSYQSQAVQPTPLEYPHQLTIAWHTAAAKEIFKFFEDVATSVWKSPYRKTSLVVTADDPTADCSAKDGAFAIGTNVFSY